MKYFGLLLALSIVSPFALAEDYITGSCSFKITDNDTTSNLFTEMNLDKNIDALDESEVDSSFRVDAASASVIHQKFERIVPYWKDVNKYQHFQVVVFENDYKSKVDTDTAGVDYKRIPLKGGANVKIGYGGRNEISADSIRVDRFGNIDFNSIRAAKTIQQVTINVSDINDNPIKTLQVEFDKDGNVDVDFEYKVPFMYRAYKGDGFLGTFRSLEGPVTVSEADKAKREKHESKVEANCKIILNKASQAEKDRSSEDQKEEENDTPFTTEFGDDDGFTSGSPAAVRE